MKVALEFRCTVCDALYLSVAVDEDCPLVTADKRLFVSFSQTLLGERLVWVEEAPLA